MSRFIESICFDNNSIRNLDFHQKRVNHSRETAFGSSDILNLEEALKEIALPKSTKCKIRVLYGKQIDSIEVIPYLPKKMNTFKLIENNEIDYSFKYEDRQVFSKMKASVNADEIIIVKNGHITDTSFSNIIFFDGSQWFTPDTYLLNGTMRLSLLDRHLISKKVITSDNIRQFRSFKLINAMLYIDESPSYDISAII